ncbi:MAG TPA: DUF5689 domain-containing protein [Bacteroidia bacterium]|nr:DUF5689 domain-containing protein [Bacteroidia bacterium]
MKAKQIANITAALLVAGAALLFSCKKNLAEPSHMSLAVGPSVTIQDLRNMYANQNIKFTSNSLLHAVVTMDESSGNIYKQVYIRDNSGTSATGGYGAISVHFLSSSNGYLAVGDSIAINLNGVTLDISGGGSLQLDSILATKHIQKIKTGLNPAPLVVTLPQLNTVVNNLYVFDGHLVQINSAEFITQNVGQSYAIGQNPPAAPISYNRYLNDCIGNTMITYNSGYANFAYSTANPITIPNASGSVVAISNVYNTMQLTLRSYPEINLFASYCPVVYDTITTNFSCAALESKKTVMFAGWTNTDIRGNLRWTGLQYGNPPMYKYSPSASNYKSNDSINDMWWISPPIVDHGGGAKKYMDFTTALQYGTGTSKRCLSVLVSGTYNGVGNPAQFSWTDITPIYTKIQTNSVNGYPNFRYASNNGFSPSSPLLGFVPPANSGNFYVAFRYRTNQNYVDSTGMTYLIGNFILKNNP